jgi:hypothetical protein
MDYCRARNFLFAEYQRLAKEHDLARNDYLASLATRDSQIIIKAAFDYMPKMINFNEFRTLFLVEEQADRRKNGENISLDNLIMDFFGENYIKNLGAETHEFVINWRKLVSEKLFRKIQTAELAARNLKA